MKNLLATFLRVLGLGGVTPTTRFGRWRRRAERTGLALAVFYVVLQAYPQVLFAHGVTTPQGITFHARTSLPAGQVAACAALAAERLDHSELRVPDRPEHVFICDSPWLFFLFSPTSAQSFAYSVPLTDHVFIASADFEHDTARSSAPVYNARSLSGVVAHEITHGLIRHRLGWWRGVRLPAWVAEGYCDYVAGGGSFPDAQGLRLLAAGQTDTSASFRYFEDRQMVRYLLEGQHLDFAGLVDRADDEAAVRAETRRSLQATKER